MKSLIAAALLLVLTFPVSPPRNGIWLLISMCTATEAIPAGKVRKEFTRTRLLIAVVSTLHAHAHLESSAEVLLQTTIREGTALRNSSAIASVIHSSHRPFLLRLN